MQTVKQLRCLLVVVVGLVVVVVVVYAVSVLQLFRRSEYRTVGLVVVVCLRSQWLNRTRLCKSMTYSRRGLSGG